MTPKFVPITSFNYTHLSAKYSLYLYREQQVDKEFDSSGIPVIFIPGNAGSFRQVRALAAASSIMSHAHSKVFPLRSHSSLNHDSNVNFDYFTVDFKEDLTAFHGKSLYDQAEYLNDAVAHIISLYAHRKDSANVVLPTSVILIGHSMGGVVARTMLTLDNYKKGSVNTILTLSAPHTVAPVSFDREIVGIYEMVNRYWEQSFSQDFIGRNPLASVSIVSIAGGGLDNMITSESAGISSFVPPSNGFTVYSNSIPHVWSGIDHQAIVWCDQFRQVFASAMRDIADPATPSKTKSLAERMVIFRKHFLGGFDMGSSPNYLEMKFQPAIKGAEKLKNETYVLPDLQPPDTLLWLHDIAKSTTPFSQHVAVKDFSELLGNAQLIPIPPDSHRNLIFSLLTDSNLAPADFSAISGIYVLACRYPHTESQIFNPELRIIDLTTNHNYRDSSKDVALLCRNIGSDFSKLPHHPKCPAKQATSCKPNNYDHLSLVQYDVSQLSNYDMIALVNDKVHLSDSFAVAEFNTKSSSSITITNPIFDFFKGVSVVLPHSKPIMVDISYSSIWSSLLAFQAEIRHSNKKEELFPAFLRQYSGDSYDSRYFMNVKNSSLLDISVLGVAPFSPFGIREYDGDFEGNLFYFGQKSHYYHNLHLQVWSDGSATTEFEVILKIDFLGSLGKFVLHYRAAIVVFPIAIISMVLAIQYRIYSRTDVFIKFSDALYEYLKHLFVPSLSFVTILPFVLKIPLVRDLLYTIEPGMDFISGDGPSSIFTNTRRNQFFLGLEPGHLWFLGGIFLCIAVGITILTNCVLKILISTLGQMWSYLVVFDSKSRQYNRLSSQATRKVLTSAFLFLAISFAIPFQLAFSLVLIAHFFLTIKGYTRRHQNENERSFYNFLFSMLMLMFWLVPITVPTLVAWIRELCNQKFITIHGYQNIIAMCPMVWFATILASGENIPKPQTRFQQLGIEFYLGYISIYSILFGIPRAYMLYFLVNALCAMLVCLWIMTKTNKELRRSQHKRKPSNRGLGQSIKSCGDSQHHAIVNQPVAS